MMDWFKHLLPEQAGLNSQAVDNVYLFMVAVSTVISVIVVALIIIFSIKYRQRPGHEATPIHGNLVMELTWTIVPIFIVMFMFAWGVSVYFKQMRIPADAQEVFVVGKQWMWKIQHAEGPREMNELHVPINTPVKLTLTSEDVIHSFYMPAFRIKMDAVPGKYTFTWFQAIKPGKYHLFCAEYCGTKHSEMIGYIYVMEQADYQAWIAERIKTPTEAVVYSNAQTPQTRNTLNTVVRQDTVMLAGNERPEIRGAKLFTELKCNSCHSAVSGPMGPDLTGLFGRKVDFEQGASIHADENYIRESILTPSEKIVRGYQALMPTYKGQIDEQQILELVSYIKNLSNNADA